MAGNLKLTCQQNHLVTKPFSSTLVKALYPGFLPITPLKPQVRSPRSVYVCAVDEDAELEKRLDKLRKAKGAAPVYSKIEDKVEEKKVTKTSYDFSDETVYYEGAPHRGDLAINMLLGVTLLWLPLTLAAVGRAIFVNYRFTNKRLVVTTTAPWKTETLEAAYQEVKEVKSVGRGVGLWGDMVVVLKDGSKVEMRSLDRFKELEKYIMERRTALGGDEDLAKQLMDESEPLATKSGSSRKGFA